MAFPASARRVRIAAAVSAAVLGGTLLAGSAEAVASPVVLAQPTGTVNAPSGLNVRQYPSTDSSVEGLLRNHQTITIDCKVRAQNISGNTVWYKLYNQNRWVTAKYVTNHATVQYCKDAHPTAMNNSSASKRAMG